MSPYIKQIRFVFKGLIYNSVTWTVTKKDKNRVRTEVDSLLDISLRY
jgi:hypothetical protein